MSFYTTTLFLFKETNESISKVNALLNKYNDAIKELGFVDEVWASLNEETIQGYRVITCSGRNVTFGNIKAALDDLGLVDLHYVDYIHTDMICLDGSSDLASNIFTLNDRIPIAWDYQMGDAKEQLYQYFDNKYESYIAALIDEFKDIGDIVEYINNSDRYHLTWLYCEPNGVDDSADIEF